MKSRSFSLPVVVALLLSGVAARAADRTVTDKLDKIDAEVGSAEGRLDRLSREYGERRGLIGGEEALKRYENAVFDYLMGEYETAATTFYSLVDSRALGDPALHQDSEWYLGECLFELGNWSTALDAYDVIIERGSNHLFFADAVRRELEIYGILRDHEKFYDLYEKWILSGRVPTTDSVKYTVAKSFYLQGEVPRAKAMFSELSEDGEYYGRSRYYLGTILAAEGEYDKAVAEFDKIIAREGKEPLDVVELANLALGRLYYEKGEFTQATDYYRKISSSSPYFADQLYELVWTYIKREQWDNALRHLEIFLLAFPEHAYTLQMKLIQGHLYMKQDAHERALASYEKVVRDYTPLHDRIEELERSREDPAAFFERIVESNDEAALAQSSSEYDMPRYAVEMLVDDDTMARAVDANRELVRQHSDIDTARTLIAEVDTALSGSDQTIGTFNRGRVAVGRIEDAALLQRSALVLQEIEYLVDNVSDDLRPEVRALKRRWEVLQTRSDEIAGEESARSDSYQVHEDQVREVQRYAFAVHQVAIDMQAELHATRRVLEDKRGGLDPKIYERTRDDLEQVQAGVEQSVVELERLEADATRRSVMATVDKGEEVDSEEQRKLIVHDYEELHDLLGNYRRQVADSSRGAVFERHDKLWRRLADIESRAVTVRDNLNRSEVSELKVLRERLAEQKGDVSRLAVEVDGTSEGARELATDITRTGFGQLEGQLYDSIMRADMGIVDVYWLRKTQVTDKIHDLATERGQRLQDLDARFDIIRQKLEE